AHLPRKAGLELLGLLDVERFEVAEPGVSFEPVDGLRHSIERRLAETFGFGRKVKYPSLTRSFWGLWVFMGLSFRAGVTVHGEGGTVLWSRSLSERLSIAATRPPIQEVSSCLHRQLCCAQSAFPAVTTDSLGGSFPGPFWSQWRRAQPLRGALAGTPEKSPSRWRTAAPCPPAYQVGQGGPARPSGISPRGTGRAGRVLRNGSIGLGRATQLLEAQ